MTYLQQQQPPGPFESRDGDGAGDHDQPYQFGWRPRRSVPHPIAHASTHACWSSASRLQDRSAGEVKADGTGSIVAAA